MSLSTDKLLLIVALIVFALATINQPKNANINMIALGLFIVTLVLFLL